MYASGANIRPSCASSVNTGRNENATIISEKNSDGPTSRQPSRIASMRPGPSPDRSSLRWTFSIITIAASTIVPIAIAMPPIDMMLALMPCRCITVNADSTAIGVTITTINPDRRW